jgi:helix-turn-helix protein
MKETPNYYAILPAEVRYDQNISSLAKLLYAEITALSQKEGFAWANNQYFADLYNVHKDTISSIVGDLIQAKYIKIEVFKDKGNIRKIWLLPLNLPRPIGKKTDTYRQKRLDPIGKKTDIILQENIITNKADSAFNEPTGPNRPDHRSEPLGSGYQKAKAMRDKLLVRS